MKQKIIFIASLLLAVLVGMALMHAWDIHRPVPVDNAPTEALLETGMWENVPQVDLQQATEPEGVQAVGDPGEAQLATESQLAPIHMPEIQTVISRSGKTYEPQEEKSAGPVVLGDAQYNTAPAAEKNIPAQEPKSSIVMIAAPVEPLLIKTTEEYKAFKRRARGSYPVANFASEQVLVLESSSNLPDKVFEIQDVQEQDGKLVVTYRVSVFGLDKKTNTHSARVIPKKDVPLELKQVL